MLVRIPSHSSPCVCREDLNIHVHMNLQAPENSENRYTQLQGPMHGTAVISVYVFLVPLASQVINVTHSPFLELPRPCEPRFQRFTQVPGTYVLRSLEALPSLVGLLGCKRTCHSP